MCPEDFFAQPVRYTLLLYQGIFRLHKTHNEVVFSLPPQSRDSRLQRRSSLRIYILIEIVDQLTLALTHFGGAAIG
jgi:hypothetical protein